MYKDGDLDKKNVLQQRKINVYIYIFRFVNAGEAQVRDHVSIMESLGQEIIRTRSSIEVLLLH